VPEHGAQVTGDEWGAEEDGGDVSHGDCSLVLPIACP
jgi:hypothetical protein